MHSWGTIAKEDAETLTETISVLQSARVERVFLKHWIVYAPEVAIGTTTRCLSKRSREFGADIGDGRAADRVVPGCHGDR